MSENQWLVFLKAMTFIMLCMLGTGIVSRTQNVYRTPGKHLQGRNYFQQSTSQLPPIALRLSSTIHYQLKNTTTSQREFSALLPPNGHTVHIDTNLKNDHDKTGSTEVYTVTLFHQLKCLDILRIDYVADRPAIQSLSPASKHCLDYLKQSLLCRPSLGLETIQTPTGHASRSYDALCRDWSVVYAEAERNQISYTQGVQ